VSDLLALVEQYGSPLYVYELPEVRRACQALRAALPDGSHLFYSLKANPHPELVRALAELGCRAEVSSLGELEAALSAGCAASEMLYTGPGKSRREVDEALAAGVTQFSFDSPVQGAVVGAAAKAAGRTVRGVLRVNPDGGSSAFGLAMGGGPSPFGFDASAVRKAAREFASDGWVDLRGFHFYVGTNADQPEALLATFETAIATAVELQTALGIELELLDLGGGFGQAFAAPGARVDFTALKAPLERMLDARLPGWRRQRPQIAFESGRYLVGAAGTLVCTVEDVKASGDRTFAVLDSGVNHLGGLGGLRKITPGQVKVELLSPGADAPLAPVDVVGPLCTPADGWARNVALPRLAPGQRLVVRNVGAYGITASLLAFLSREAPVEVVVDGARVSASRLSVQRSSVAHAAPSRRQP